MAKIMEKGKPKIHKSSTINSFVTKKHEDSYKGSKTMFNSLKETILPSSTKSEIEDWEGGGQFTQSGDHEAGGTR